MPAPRIAFKDAAAGWTRIFRRRSICRTPTIREMEVIECGAACLGMILAYHGLWIPLEQLRVACGVSRDGVKASNLIAAARGFGLTAQGYRREPSQLHELRMPCVLHWNFEHFVVLEGLRGEHAYINDPSTGRRRIAMAELDAAFTGVVLAFQPSAEFRRAGRKPHLLGILGRALAHSKAAVALLMILSATLVVPGILIPSFVKVFVDDILIARLDGWLLPLLTAMGAAALGRAGITALQQSLLLRLETKYEVTLVARFLRHLLSLPMEFFNQRHAGDIVSRVAGNERVARLLSGGMAVNALSLVSLMFFATVMVMYDARLAVITIALSLLNVAALQAIAQRRENLSRDVAIQRGKLNGSMVGLIRMIETVKASGLEDGAFARWAGFQAKALNAEHSFRFYSVLLDSCPALLTALGTMAVLCIGGLRVMDGALTLGGLVAFQSLQASFDGPIATLVQLAGNFQMLKGDLLRMEDVFNYPAEKPRPAPTGWPDKLSGRLEFKDVRFGYSPLDPPFVDGFSLVLEPGVQVAIVGHSGSGKTTIGRLACGLNRPWSGEILLDGQPLSGIPVEVFAKSVGYVDQEIVLFEGTLRENLTLWEDTVPDTDIARAIADAMIHDEIMTRPGGYDCRIAEGGVNFSGGQQQRIEIARTLVGKRSLLILDEATSALDATTEAAIHDNLRRRGCTCILVSHRLSAIRDCDEIIVLEEGAVVERGTHTALLALNGTYARLVQS